MPIPRLRRAISFPPPAITVTPTPVARLPPLDGDYSPMYPTPTPDPRRQHFHGLPRRVERRVDFRQHEIGNVTVEQRQVGIGPVAVSTDNGVVLPTERKRRLEDLSDEDDSADPYYATSSAASSSVTLRSGAPLASPPYVYSDAAFRARWGIDSPASPPAERQPLTLSAIRRSLNPHAVPVPVSPTAELMNNFFTPVNVKPGYFEVQVATTDFRVWVNRETKLRDVVRVVERELLAAEGWPGLVGLCYVGGEVGGVWSESDWKDVRREGKGRKEGVAEVELVF